MHCHVGAVLPKMAPSGRTLYQLCQKKKCVHAGQFGTFGTLNTSRCKVATSIHLLSAGKVKMCEPYFSKEDIGFLALTQGPSEFIGGKNLVLGYPLTKGMLS